MMQQLSGPTAPTSDPVAAILQAFPCGCLLLRDSLAASGQFLLPWITATSLAQAHKVVFVAAAYSPAKHKAALKKIGVPGVSSTAADSSSSSSSSSSIAFVSPAAVKPVRKDTDSTRQQQQEPQHSMPRLQQLYQQIVAAARQLVSQQQQPPQQQQQQQQLTVVVDSLTVLSSLVCDDVQAAAFTHYMMALGEVLQVPCRLILLAATDIPADAPLLAAAAARAHVIADVAPLEGRTAALDGSLTVTVKHMSGKWTHTDPGLQQQGDSVQQQQQQHHVVPSWLQPGSSGVWFFRAGDVGVRWLPQVHGKELMA